MIESNNFFNFFPDDLAYIPDLKCVLDNKNAFLIYPFRSVLLRSVPIFLRMHSCVPFKTMGSFLLAVFVLVKEGLFFKEDAQSYI